MSDTDAPSWSDLYDVAKAEAQSRRTDLTFEDGDISDMIMAAVSAVGDRIIGYAAERFKATYVDGATGEDLTTLADDHWTIQRAAASYAVGTVAFSRSAGSLPAVTIDAGTVVATEKAADGSEVQYATDTATSYALSETGTKSVTATAVVAGRDGNVAASTVTRIITTLDDSNITVTNTTAMAGGAEEESDDELRERIREYSTTLRRATLAALEYGAKQVAGVSNATADESVNGIVTVYITDADGGSSAALVADVLEELEDWRAAGIIVNVTGGSLYSLTPITITLSVRTGVDTAAIATSVKDAIVARIDKLKIGETCTRALIQSAAMSVDDAVLGCTVTLPAADVVPSAYQIIRTTTSDVTVA